METVDKRSDIFYEERASEQVFHETTLSASLGGNRSSLLVYNAPSGFHVFRQLNVRAEAE